jgi:tetratricopeptide (TPR) repeat protein
MDSMAQPLMQVVKAVQQFIIAPEVRLLHVVTEPSLRLAVLEHIAAGEHHGDNHAPFFVLETPTWDGEDEWEGRAEELRADYEELRALLAKEGQGVSLPEIWPPPHGQRELARFCVELSEALRRFSAPPFGGVVLVLAPVEVRDPKRWVSEVKALLARRELRNARLIVVEADGPHSEALAVALAKEALRVDARPDEKQLREDMAQMLAGMAAAPAGATGAQVVGAAGPRVAPPPRKKAPPPMSDAQREELARELKLAPALLDPGFQQALRLKVFSAAHAMREGKAAQAIQVQREARDMCLGAGLNREAVTLELVLGGYVLQAKQAPLALEVFRDARKRAEAHQLAELAVQAQLSTASTLLVLQHLEEAALAYAEAGKLGVAASQPILAIEGYRMSGQVLAGAGKVAEATSAWKKALEAADKAAPEERSASSASEAARQLAALCRKHGLKAQAESLEAQAVTLEAPPTRAQEA